MPNMVNYLTRLEDLPDLENEIIKTTKVHKVLKGIIKLNNIPRESEFNIKKRSQELLAKWGSLTSEAEIGEAVASVAPATNGVKHEEEKANAPASGEPEEIAKPTDEDKNSTMADAKDEDPVAEAEEEATF